MTPTDSLTHIRRQNRAVNDEAWIKAFLRQALFGVFATAHEGQPFATPKLFAYDEATHAIYFHTADQGRTSDNVRADGRVCFVASQMGRLLPAEKSSNFGVEYASVVVFGQARILDGVDERRYGLQLLLDKYFPRLRPGVHYPKLEAEEMLGAAVYRLEISGWSAKRKEAPDDFPGAFTFGANPDMPA